MPPLEQLGWGLPKVAYLLLNRLQCMTSGSDSEAAPLQWWQSSSSGPQFYIQVEQHPVV